MPDYKNHRKHVVKFDVIANFMTEIKESARLGVSREDKKGLFHLCSETV